MIKKMGLTFAFVGSLSACTTEQVLDNTGDAVVFVGETAVRGVFGASRLVYRGAAAGVRRLQRPDGGFPAGTIVCQDVNGAIYAAAVENADGVHVCPDPS
ncbi:MAG: hypothetical protein AAGL89_15290 [Pseudomonadota bacterium]